MASKEILLKYVVQALPVYTMSCFKLPKGLYKGISKKMARFWWRSNREKENKIHWLAWEKLTKAKEDMGVLVSKS